MIEYWAEKNNLSTSHKQLAFNNFILQSNRKILKVIFNIGNKLNKMYIAIIKLYHLFYKVLISICLGIIIMFLKLKLYS